MLRSEANVNVSRQNPLSMVRVQCMGTSSIYPSAVLVDGLSVRKMHEMSENKINLKKSLFFFRKRKKDKNTLKTQVEPQDAEFCKVAGKITLSEFRFHIISHNLI